MLLPFPRPPAAVAGALDDLAVVRSGDDDAIAELGGPHAIADLPRPWDPSSCRIDLREQLWEWLDDVAAWLNHEYAWRSTTLIPPCWPQHPHLARELAVLACLRAAAGDAISPDPLEDWHRYALPHFLERMTGRLGDNGCRTGHTDWPAAGRYDHFVSDTAVTARMDTFYTDTHPPARLHAAGSWP